MNASRFANGFSEKVLFQGKQTTFCLQMACPHNFGSALRIFLKFCTMKRAKRYMEIILITFLKKFSFRVNQSGPEMTRCQNLRFSDVFRL